jgi:hypothetical protein
MRDHCLIILRSRPDHFDLHLHYCSCAITTAFTTPPNPLTTRSTDSECFLGSDVTARKSAFTVPLGLRWLGNYEMRRGRRASRGPKTRSVMSESVTTVLSRVWLLVVVFLCAANHGVNPSRGFHSLNAEEASAFPAPLTSTPPSPPICNTSFFLKLFFPQCTFRRSDANVYRHGAAYPCVQSSRSTTAGPRKAG